MAAPRRPPVDELRVHLAHEVHWLVWSAVAFTTDRSMGRTALLDSALLHARNLLQFSAPRLDKRSWWVGGLGVDVPEPDGRFNAWSNFIHSRVLHMGSKRYSKKPPWPVDEANADRCEDAARYVLVRLGDAASGKEPTDNAPDREALGAVAEIVGYGLAFLDSHDPRYYANE